MADSFEAQFHAALQGCPDPARDVLAKILSMFKLVRRVRPSHQMTDGDVDAVLVFPRLFTYDLPSNPFWAQNASVLGPQLQLAVMDWIESAVHAPQGDPSGLNEAQKREWVSAKEREVGMRATVFSFIVQAVMLAGGDVSGLRERLAQVMVSD